MKFLEVDPRGERASVVWLNYATHDRWYFRGRRCYDNGAASIVVPASVLQWCTLTDLRRALIRAQEREYLPDSILVAADGLEEFDEDYVPVEPVSFVFLPDGRIAADIYLDVPHDVDPEECVFDVVDAIAPFLRRARAEVVEAAPHAYLVASSLQIVIPSRGRTMGDLYTIGQRVFHLASALLNKESGRETLRDLLLGGNVDLVLGQEENEWFDAKADHYLRDGRSEGKIMLARSVAQFCNGHTGGILLVGAKTGKESGTVGERVVRLTPVPVDGATKRRYRDALEKHLFPFPVGLDIDVISAEKSGSGYVIVSLPPQPEEMKPYLVHGAILGSKSEGSFFSIIQRSGEDGLPIHPSQVHTMLVTGRALLRHGLMPNTATEPPPLEAPGRE